MKPLEFPLLADENIAATVITELVRRGRSVRSVSDEGLTGRSDTEIIRHARAHDQVVLTHDTDFGKLTFARHERFVGVIFIKPGHITARYVLDALLTLESSRDVVPPFIIVVDRKEDRVRIRLRDAFEF